MGMKENERKPQRKTSSVRESWRLSVRGGNHRETEGKG